MEMTISFPGGSRVDAAFGGYTVCTDQPVRHGGEGTAPAPFDLFLASIGSCAGFYVLKFLEQRGLPVADVRLDLKTHRNPETRHVDEIVLEVHLPDDFPPKYQRAIINSVNLCSVKKHLIDPPRIRTEIRTGQTSSLG